MRRASHQKSTIATAKENRLVVLVKGRGETVNEAPEEEDEGDETAAFYDAGLPLLLPRFDVMRS